MSNRITDPERLAELREKNNYRGQPDRCNACGSAKRAPGLCCIVCGQPHPDRSEIYAAIDVERDYQDYRHRHDPHTVLEWVVMMSGYLKRARESFQAGDLGCKDQMLSELRKCVALGVACMEQHGIVHRDRDTRPTGELSVTRARMAGAGIGEIHPPQFVCDVCGDTEVDHKIYGHAFIGAVFEWSQKVQEPVALLSDFRKAIEGTINHFSQENGSNTPDFILAEYLTDCLAAYDKAVSAREKWYGRGPKPLDPQPVQEGLNQ